MNPFMPTIVRDVERLSYWGHYSHANSFRLRQQLMQQFPWLPVLFSSHQGKLIRKYYPPKQLHWCEGRANLVSQLQYFRHFYPQVLLC